LKEACDLTQVCWAAWVSRVGAEWQSGESHRLTKARQAELLKMLAEKPFDSLLSGSLAAGRVRSRALEKERLVCKKLFAFPATGTSLVLVGVDKDFRDQDSGVIAEYAVPCPPYCPIGSQLDS
jgi:hypothetical protein